VERLLACLIWYVPCALMASPADIVMNEVMYNPPDGPEGDELEFLELYNRGAEEVDISGWKFTEGISFTFPPGTIIEPESYLVVCSDPAEMLSRYGIYNIIGPFSGRLSNQGERVALSDNSDVPTLIDEVDYETGGDWPGEPDGNGPSLELVNPWVDNSIGAHWRASQPRVSRGTPGGQNSCHQANPPPVITGVSRIPVSPTSTQAVVITATVRDDTAVQSVSLYYVAGQAPDAETTTLQMDDLGDGTYSATIPHHADGTWVWYSIAAVDDSLAVGWWPLGAPESKAWYLVDNQPAIEGDIVINEIMYHNTDEKGQDLEWVEIFNASTRTIDLSRWCLKDDEDAHSFYLPRGTSLSPGEFLVLCHDLTRTVETYGIDNVVGNFSFRLSDGGSLVRLFDANGMLLDLVEYEDSSPWPDEADGGGASLECVNPFADNSLFSNWGPGLPEGSPGEVNSIYSPFNHDGDIVMNEIMYHPADDDDDAQFLELFNRGYETVDLSNWRFTRGITHTFGPEDPTTRIPPGGFLVLCKDASKASKLYKVGAPAVTWEEGRLDHGGETLALENAVGVTIDIVKYNDEPPWPVAADGFGSSLECINPYVDNNHPRNWRASSGKAYWQFVQRTGVGTSGQLYFYMLEPGECLIDEVSITEVGGSDNCVPNGDFETGEWGWQMTGNHAGSFRETGQAHSGNACMHIVATGTGESSTNSVNVLTIPELVRDETYVLSFWVKHVKGGTRLFSRLSGGGIGGETALAGSGLLSSPGRPNAAFSLDLPPFISSVEHIPSMPRPKGAGKIVSAVEDDVEVASVVLQYKSALEDSWTSVEMHDDGLDGDAVAGDGLYAAMTASYPSQTVVQYIVVAWDNAGNATQSPAANDPKPNHAYFVYNREVISKLPVYFMTIPTLASINPSSDNYHPATFVYQGNVYENVGVRYRGGTARSYPKKCLKVRFNKGDLFTGSFDNALKSINLQAMWADKSYLREKLAYDMFKKMGVAYCETRHVLLYINGSYWGLFLEMEAPGRRYLKRNGRDDTGNLYKAAFSMSGGTGTSAQGFEKKTNETDGSKADLESFLWGINNTPLEEITDYLNTHTLVDSHIAYNAVGCVIGSADQPHKNHFLYHDPTSDKWEMFPWDMDLTYGRNYYPGHGVCNDLIRWDSHIFLCSRIHPNYDGFWNRVIDRFFYPESGQDSAYTEPFRTKMVETTKYVLDNFFTRTFQYQEIDSLVELIREEAVRDRAKWGSYNSVDANLDSQVGILKNFITNRRNYLFTNFLTDSNAPSRPRNIYPRSGDYAVFPTAVLQPGSYKDPNGDTHAASQWQIREDGNYWTETVLDEETEEKLSSYEVPLEKLEPLKIYYWRLRFKDGTGLWGNWSDETSFAIGLDTDADGLCDSAETNTAVYVSAGNTGTDPRNPDTDGDGLLDGEEVTEFRTNPILPDSDGDGLSDWEEVKTYLTNANDHDTDADGMDDFWEILHGLSPTDPTGENGADGDPDTDGATNIEELIAGTDPNSAQSVFAIASLRCNNPGVAFSWRTVLGKRYQVYTLEELAGEWSALGGEIVGTGDEVTTFTDEAAEAEKVRYYRVLVE